MSNRPGIGAHAIEPIVEALFSQFGKSMLTDTGDVPTILNQGAKPIYLDRYTRNKIREAIGVNEETIQKTNFQYQEELLDMYQNILFDPTIPSKDKPYSLKKFIQDRDKQKILNIKTQSNIYKKRRNL